MAKDVDFIALWEKGKALSPKVEIDVDQAIRSSSKGTLFWIKIILTIELWINIAFLPVLVYLFFWDTTDYAWGISLLIITVVYILYYRFLISEVSHFTFTDEVRTGLRKLYRYLNFFLLHYKIVIWISLLIGLVKGLSDVEPDISEKTPDAWVAIIGVSLVLITIIGLIFTFLINLIYGRKIKRLKKLVKAFA